jgi:hypothetical protein
MFAAEVHVSGVDLRSARSTTWTPDGESIVEHVAAIEDYELPSPRSAPSANAGPAHPSPCGRVRE